MYKIRPVSINDDESDVKGSFYENELQDVNFEDDYFAIDRIIKKFPKQKTVPDEDGVVLEEKVLGRIRCTGKIPTDPRIRKSCLRSLQHPLPPVYRSTRPGRFNLLGERTIY